VFVFGIAIEIVIAIFFSARDSNEKPVK